MDAQRRIGQRFLFNIFFYTFKMSVGSFVPHFPPSCLPSSLPPIFIFFCSPYYPFLHPSFYPFFPPSFFSFLFRILVTNTIVLSFYVFFFILLFPLFPVFSFSSSFPSLLWLFLHSSLYTSFVLHFFHPCRFWEHYNQSNRSHQRSFTLAFLIDEFALLPLFLRRRFFLLFTLGGAGSASRGFEIRQSASTDRRHSTSTPRRRQSPKGQAGSTGTCADSASSSLSTSFCLW